MSYSKAAWFRSCNVTWVASGPVSVLFWPSFLCSQKKGAQTQTHYLGGRAEKQISACRHCFLLFQHKERSVNAKRKYAPSIVLSILKPDFLL